MYNVLAVDGIAAEGLEILKKNFNVEVHDKISPEQLLEIIPKFDALIVRSASKVTAEVIARAKNLKIIGRAGVGVDNIDVKAATEQHNRRYRAYFCNDVRTFQKYPASQ